MPSSRHTSAMSFPSPSILSACASFRTTCSGVCRFLVVMIKSFRPEHGHQDSHSMWINQLGSRQGHLVAVVGTITLEVAVEGRRIHHEDCHRRSGREFLKCWTS